MNIDKFKQQHVEILRGIAALRTSSKAGIAEHADEIARQVVSMSAVIKLHLAAEDHVLYPALQAGQDRTLARLGTQFQQEMAAIVRRYAEFARHWSTPAQVRRDPQRFRDEANDVLRTLHERMQRENHDFYPAIEQLEAA